MGLPDQARLTRLALLAFVTCYFHAAEARSLAKECRLVDPKEYYLDADHESYTYSAFNLNTDDSYPWISSYTNIKQTEYMWIRLRKKLKIGRIALRASKNPHLLKSAPYWLELYGTNEVNPRGKFLFDNGERKFTSYGQELIFDVPENRRGYFKYYKLYMKSTPSSTNPDMFHIVLERLKMWTCD